MSLDVRLDTVTAAVLLAYASSVGLSLSEVCSHLLYKDASAMTGWPGSQGAALRSAALDAMGLRPSPVFSDIPF